MGENSGTKVEENLEDICRLCLRTNGNILIWDNGLKYWHQIKEFCQLQIHESDGLPRHICWECSATLGAMEYLREKAQESDKYLRSKLDVSNKTFFLDIKEINDRYLDVKKEPNIETESECVDSVANIEFHYENSSCDEDVMFPCSPTSSWIPNQLLKIEKNAENVAKDEQEPKMYKKGEWVCPICNKVLQKYSAYRHLKNHRLKGENVSKEFICSKCTCSFFSKKELESHMKFYCLKNTYACSVCGKEFKTRRFVTRHMRVVHEGREARKCQVCQKVLASSGSYATHLKTHSEEKFKLNTCNKGVEGERVKHVKREYKKRIKVKQLCPICGKVIGSSFDLHLQNHKAEGENIDKEFKCSKCYFSFHSKERLEKHMKYHLLEKIYPCNLCGKKFKHKHIVNKHIKLIHKRYEQTECSICHKVVQCKISLKKHMSTHTGETQYECDICKKKLTSKLGLICHLRIHTGEKPYKCDICNSNFRIKNSLVEHMRLHTGEKPYRCPVCDKGFAQKCNMKSHFKYNHKNEVYEEKNKFIYKLYKV